MHKIAILGFGTVGSGLGEALLTDRERLTRHLGDGLDIKYILDLREFPGHPLGDRVVHDFNIILNDPEIELFLDPVAERRKDLKLLLCTRLVSLIGTRKM